MKYKRSEHNWKLIGINSSSSEYWIITAQVLDFTLLGVTSCARINKPWPSSVFRKDFILRLAAGGICILQNSSDWHSFFLQTFFPLFFFFFSKAETKTISSTASGPTQCHWCLFWVNNMSAANSCTQSTANVSIQDDPFTHSTVPKTTECCPLVWEAANILLLILG